MTTKEEERTWAHCHQKNSMMAVVKLRCEDVGFLLLVSLEQVGGCVDQDACREEEEMEEHHLLSHAQSHSLSQVYHDS